MSGNGWVEHGEPRLVGRTRDHWASLDEAVAELLECERELDAAMAERRAEMRRWASGDLSGLGDADGRWMLAEVRHDRARANVRAVELGLIDMAAARYWRGDDR